MSYYPKDCAEELNTNTKIVRLNLTENLGNKESLRMVPKNLANNQLQRKSNKKHSEFSGSKEAG
jgi:hypothetical protein